MPQTNASEATQRPALTRTTFPDAFLQNLELTDPDSAITLARHYLDDALRTGDNVLISGVLLRMGSIYFHKNNFVASLEAYSKAMPYTNATGVKSRMGHLQIYLGNVFYHQKMYPEAREFYVTAEKYFNEDTDTLGHAVAYNNLALCDANLGNYSSAEQLFRKALALRKKKNIPHLLIHSYGYLIDLARRQNNYAEGRRLAAAVDSLSRGRSYTMAAEIDVVAETVRKCGLLYAAAGDFAAATRYFTRALTSGNPRDNNFSSMVKLDLARAALSTGNSTGSARLATEAIALANAGANVELMQEANSFLASLFEARGDHRRALHYTKETLRLHEASSVATITNQLYDHLLYIKSHQMDELLRAKQRELAAEQEKNRVASQNTYLMAGALLILVLFLLFAINGVQRERKLNEELTRRNDEVMAQRAEIHAQKESIEQMFAELEQVNRSRDKLYSVFVHDLKNPLHNLLAIADVLAEEFKSMPETEQVVYLGHLQTSAQRLNTLIFDMLNWLRLQLSKTEVTIRPVAPRLVSERVAATLLHAAQKKGVEVLNHIPGSLLVSADETSLESIYYNLLHNAIKFSKSGAAVTLNGTEDKQYITLTVHDTGIGFEPIVLEKFRKYDIIPTSTGTAGEPGTGFGLMIIRDLLALNNGSIALESTPGEGSTFTITLKRVA